MNDKLDAVVVGAGIVGLAVARALGAKGLSVLVVERHSRPIEETSSRNSGVIHSGIYYPKASLKARLCVDGRKRLYDFVEQRGIPHHRCGKLIVAQAGQEPALKALHAQAVANGVTDIRPLSGDEVRQREPAVRCSAGLWCPSTGIIDVHELSNAFVADIEKQGGTIAYRTEVKWARFKDQLVFLGCECEGEEVELTSSMLVNSAGLSAIALLGKLDGYPAQLLRRPYFAKGNYFALAALRPFRHLVYPMPNDAGLGIHATLDLGGAVRFGPNVEWVDDLHPAVSPGHAEEFYESIRSYWPELPAGALQPDYAGFRPKLVGPGEKAADFLIEDHSVHGIPALINLLGIESPGLTSCLAIAEHVAYLAGEGAVAACPQR